MPEIAAALGTATINTWPAGTEPSPACAGCSSSRIRLAGWHWGREPAVTITGGSGFLGHLLSRAGGEGFRVDVFDRFRGPLVDLIRRRYLASATSPPAAPHRRSGPRSRAEPALIRAGLSARGKTTSSPIAT